MTQRTIIFVQNVDFPQQGAVDIFYYTKYLSKYKDIKIKVIVSKINENVSNKNLEIIELGKTNYINFIFNAYKKIKSFNKIEKVDYVYFFAQHPFSVLLQFFVKYFLKINTIYDVVSGPIGKGIIPFISKITIKLGVKLSNRYVVLDKGIIKKLGLPQKKQHTIIPMGYDIEFFKENININLFNKNEDEIIFTYIGTLNKERNLDIFVKSFIKNLEKYENIKLYFVGFGNGEENLKNISKRYLDKNIFFLGKKEHKKIPDYINSSDILISYVPKVDYFEHQPPTKLIEYLGCNKPVIATNTIAQIEILKNYPNLIHKDDFESTKKQVLYCIENIEALKKEDYKQIVQQYNWEFLVEKIYKLL